MDQQNSAAPPDSPPADAETVRAELAAAQRMIGQLRDDLAAAGARERALVHEIQHRVRNMLAVIRSVYRRTRESGASQEEFAEHFQGRLNTIARFHSHVDDARASGFDLEDMLRGELLDAHCLDGPDCLLEGPPVLLRQRAAELMGLAIHELTTNSIKFGALSRHGRLAVTWAIVEGPQGPELDFRWIETGTSPTVSAPRPSGFGRQLIEQALPYQLGATTTFDLKPGGVECAIRLPLRPAAEEREGSTGGIRPLL